MTTDSGTDRRRSNPFTTRHTRPGRVPPLDEAGRPRNLALLLAVVRRTAVTAIVGPHGTGKSTLLTAIQRELAGAGQTALLLRLRRRRDLFPLMRAAVAASRPTTLCVDGWERLGPVAAAAVRLIGLLRGCRLVVTSHVPPRMSALVQTTASLPLLEAILARLPDPGDLITPADVSESFARHGGNLRDSLDDLYDRFEQRVRRS